MDERGVDGQHDLIIPAGIGIQARIEIFQVRTLCSQTSHFERTSL